MSITNVGQGERVFLSFPEPQLSEHCKSVKGNGFRYSLDMWSISQRAIFKGNLGEESGLDFLLTSEVDFDFNVLSLVAQFSVN